MDLSESPGVESYAGVIHRYSPPLFSFEYQPSNPSTSSVPSTSNTDLSTVIFLGGLFDTILTVPFAHIVAEQLPPSWRFMQATLSSSATGWGVSNLDKDVDELGRCVGYTRRIRPNGKIVLMGHSTGSQGVLHYLSSNLEADKRPKVNGAILQGSVSDREGLPDLFPSEVMEKTVKAAQNMVEKGEGEELLPRFWLDGFPPLTANRWLSLASPAPDHAGQDDMFSSDLGDERLQKTFGRAGASKVPLMILFSGDDQYVPANVDRDALVDKWMRVVKSNGGILHEKSGIVSGMTHNGQGSSDQAILELARRVAEFVKSL